MNINFYDDPGNIPKPRYQIKVEDIQIEPYPNQTRLKVTLETTQFTPADRPNLTIRAFNPAGEELSSLTIIETLQNTISVTLHLRQPPTEGDYTVRADLYYDDDAIQHSAERKLDLLSQNQEGK